VFSVVKSKVVMERMRAVKKVLCMHTCYENVVLWKKKIKVF